MKIVIMTKYWAKEMEITGQDSLATGKEIQNSLSEIGIRSVLLGGVL